MKLRSRTIDLKANFKTKYSNNTECSLNGCTLEESQEHIFQNCQPLIHNLNINDRNSNIKYEDIFKNTKRQIQAVQLFNKLFKKRSMLLSNA